MKKTIPAICIGFCLCFILSAYMDSTQAALSQGVIRLHVVANSDSGADQQLKLKVRDRILNECGVMFENTETIDAVKADICSNMDYIQKIASDEIAKNGYNYPVEVSFGTSDFPQKQYGNITLPAGEYQALKVNIGSAQGKNWWCVLFPPLCFVDEACVSVSADSQDKLKQQLGTSAYNMVSDASGIEFKLKSYELWQTGKAVLTNYFAKTINK
ncbi:MAG: stage II sporulation protein R [Clostridia bacterium]|nr:stage II sporulation protein R [Clostridia bacterium]